MSSPAQPVSVSEQSKVKRYIGIRPRVKRTADGEARPTQLAILDDAGLRTIELPDEQSELDFVLGSFPMSYRKVLDGEDVLMFRRYHDHHIKRDSDGKPIEVPASFEGLRQGDLVAMAMGGSGDCLAFALSRKGEDVGSQVERITPFMLKSLRGEGAKDDDASFLARLVSDRRELFTPVYVRDRKIVRVRELQRLRIDVMKARIGCEQRLRQRFIGEIFCSEAGLYPEGAIEKEFEAKKASDKVLLPLVAEENAAKRELEKAVHETDVWSEVLSRVEGLGPAIAARLISTIQDIRRFETAPKLKKYLGVHVRDEKGHFPRRRAGELAGWSNEGRQAIYLLLDQLNRRPGSEWGQKLLANKAHYQARYPHPHLVFTHEGQERTAVLTPGTFEKKGSKYILTIEDKLVTVTGKLRYYKGHIHKMALWKTGTEFVDWLFDAWWKLEKRAAAKPAAPEASKAEEGAEGSQAVA
ncbi:MAG TPA: transposase [Candidatus Paceibacterota bacterium]|nr:transposase [Candidatus Paceibacterota bacterium]